MTYSFQRSAAQRNAQRNELIESPDQKLIMSAFADGFGRQDATSRWWRAGPF
jgi:hypothetical protein